MLIFIHFNPNTMIAFAAGTYDAYGQGIISVKVYQNETTWTWKGEVDHANYTLGAQVKVDALTLTRFNVSTYINNTFASSEVDALANSRTYLNITYSNGTTVVANTEITDVSASLDGTLYTIESYYLWNDAANHPIAGITYYVYIHNEVYR
jgi:hypothetical protein